MLDEDEIDAVRIESKRTLEPQFVDACEIDPLYFEKPYYAPQDELAEEAFIVLREAREAEGRAGPAVGARQRETGRGEALRQGTAARNAALCR